MVTTCFIRRLDLLTLLSHLPDEQKVGESGGADVTTAEANRCVQRWKGVWIAAKQQERGYLIALPSPVTVGHESPLYEPLRRCHSRRLDPVANRIDPEDFPRRAEADFYDDNDHNPRVLEDCPECAGAGRRWSDISLVGSDGLACGEEPCAACEGRGTTGGIVPFFHNESHSRDVVADSEGFVRCPFCGGEFNLTNSHQWTGLRHMPCGQRLRVLRGDP